MLGQGHGKAVENSVGATTSRVLATAARVASAGDRGYSTFSNDVVVWTQERPSLAAFQPAEQLDLGLGAEKA